MDPKPPPVPSPTPPKSTPSTTVVGGFPWQAPAQPAGPTPPSVPGPAFPQTQAPPLPSRSPNGPPPVPGGQIAAAPAPRAKAAPISTPATATPRITTPRTHAPAAFDDDEDVAVFTLPTLDSIPSLRELFQRSPPLTVSLAVHVVVLVMLAIWMIPMSQQRRVMLDMSFASPTITEAEERGVEIKAPTPEPEKEQVVEVAVSEKPPVEDPVAAPPPAEEMEQTPGTASDRAEATAPVVGSLLDGRTEGRRDALVLAFGGSEATEAAVARALDWMAKQQQKKDGLWSLQGPYADGGSQENRLAATAMALLAFQGAGNTSRHGRHREVVARGWKGLLAHQLPEGNFDLPPMPSQQMLYAHAQATIALCELYGMTRDDTYAGPARRAIAYALAAQGPNGGWRYEPRRPGDMSVTGWYLMALKSAQMAGIDVPEEAFAGIGRFVESVAVKDGAQYGYRRDTPHRPPVQVTRAVSAEGLLCLLYLGTRREDRRLTLGVELLLGDDFFDYENAKDVYAWYYVAQVLHHYGGEPWDRWNDRMREVLPAKQVTKGGDAGSWDPSLDKWGHAGGRLFVTAFCSFMLEVYYRHLPLYRQPPQAAASP